MFESVWQDVRHAVRSALRRPGFTAVVIATLAVVIGATTSIFSVASSLLLRPPVSDEPEHLVRVFYGRGSNMFYPDYVEHRALSRTMDLAAFDDQRVSVRIDNGMEAAFAELLTDNYFQVAGIRAALGRVFGPTEIAADGSGVAVLSHSYWRQRFGSSPAIVGQSIRVNNVDFRIVGVAPPEFIGAYGVMAADLWMPITADPLLRPGTKELVDREQARSVQVLGRLRSGVTIDQAQADAALAAADIQRRYPKQTAPGVSVQSASMLPGDVSRQAAVLLGFLLGIAVLLWVAACANIANMLLARAVSVARDIAVRQAIGASRARVVRQLLTESVLLAAAAAVLALVLTWVTTRALMAIRIPAPVPVFIDMTPDWRVLTFAIALVVLTAIACGLAPALKTSGGDLLSLVNRSAGSSTRSRMRSVFVVAQVASSVLLLILGGLFVRSLESANRIDLGMDTSNVLLVTIDTETRGYTRERALAAYDEILSRLAGTPGVAASSLADIVPLTLTRRGWAMSVPGSADAPVSVLVNSVSNGHFRTLGIPLVAGRDFEARDTATSRPVIILNETLARRWFASRSPIGATVHRLASGPVPAVDYEVIGVAADSRYASVGEAETPFAYFPIAQAFSPAPTLMVRTTDDPLQAVPAVRRVIASVDDSLPVFGINTLQASSGLSLLPARFAAAVGSTLGTLVLALSTIGLFGVVSFLVVQRRREIGIRIALGARPAAVAGLFVRQSLRWTATGVAVGILLAAGAAQAMHGLLYGVSPLDPLTFAGVITLMLTVTFAASYAPSRRAAAMNAVDTLRAE